MQLNGPVSVSAIEKREDEAPANARQPGRVYHGSISANRHEEEKRARTGARLSARSNPCCTRDMRLMRARIVRTKAGGNIRHMIAVRAIRPEPLALAAAT